MLSSRCRSLSADCVHGVEGRRPRCGFFRLASQKRRQEGGIGVTDTIAMNKNEKSPTICPA